MSGDSNSGDVSDTGGRTSWISKNVLEVAMEEEGRRN